jgi:hypothetical protein
LCLKKREQAKQPGRGLQHDFYCGTTRGPKLSSIVVTVLLDDGPREANRSGGKDEID